MINKLTSLGNAIVVAMIILSLCGPVLDVVGPLHGPRGAHSPLDGLQQGRQGPHYTGAPECLTEGVALAPECNERRELPGCLAEDGSGPGIYCFWTDPGGTGIWFNDGDESNDRQKLP